MTITSVPVSVEAQAILERIEEFAGNKIGSVKEENGYLVVAIDYKSFNSKYYVNLKTNSIKIKNFFKEEFKPHRNEDFEEFAYYKCFRCKSSEMASDYLECIHYHSEVSKDLENIIEFLESKLNY